MYGKWPILGLRVLFLGAICNKGVRCGQLYERVGKVHPKPEALPEEVVKTVLTIGEIAGKSINTLYNGLSLLKLPPEIQAAIRQGNLPVSQGYLFAANLDCPDLMKAVNSDEGSE